MKKLFMFILVAFLSTITIMAETENHVTMNGSRSSFMQIIPDNGSITYSNPSGYAEAIGNEYESHNLRHLVFRSYWYYDLTNAIPTNATITGVTVTIGNSNTQNAMFLNLTSVLSTSTNAGDNWAAIGNGSSLHTNVLYNPDNFNSAPIKDLIQSKLSQRHIMYWSIIQK
jgi:hypothetical protein